MLGEITGVYIPFCCFLSGVGSFTPLIGYQLTNPAKPAPITYDSLCEDGVWFPTYNFTSLPALFCPACVVLKLLWIPWSSIVCFCSVVPLHNKCNLLLTDLTSSNVLLFKTQTALTHHNITILNKYTELSEIYKGPWTMASE